MLSYIKWKSITPIWLSYWYLLVPIYQASDNSFVERFVLADPVLDIIPLNTSLYFMNLQISSGWGVSTSAIMSPPVHHHALTMRPPWHKHGTIMMLLYDTTITLTWHHLTVTTTPSWPHHNNTLVSLCRIHVDIIMPQCSIFPPVQSGFVYRSVSITPPVISSSLF